MNNNPKINGIEINKSSRPPFKWDDELRKLANKAGDIIRKKEMNDRESFNTESAV